MAERTRLVTDAFAAAGAVPEVRCVAGAEMGRVARQLVAERPAAIVAAGGDGTVSAVAGALAGSEVPLGILALGTLNHFARDVGIPLDPAAAAAVVAAGAARRVDVGRVNGRVFVNNASIGLYPHMVRTREARRSQRGGSKRLATFRSSWQVLKRMPLTRLRLTVDGRTQTLVTPIVLIGNNAFQLEGLALGTRSALDAGVLSVVHTTRTRPAGVARLALRAIAGALGSAEDVTAEQAQRVRVEAPRAHLRIALDGEVLSMRPPLEFEALPGALRVLAPTGGLPR